MPEGQLGEVVEAALLEQPQRAHTREREGARERLGLVVEVEEQCLAGTGLDEAVRVAIEGGGHRLAPHVVHEVVGEQLEREVRRRPGLRDRQVGRVADGEDRVIAGGQQRLAVDRDAVELVAEPA